MVTSDFSPEVEIRPFRACAMHPAIIIGTVCSLWTWLWGRCHVPQNAFLVCDTFPQFTLVGCKLQFVEHFRYLGHIIDSCLSDDKDIQRQSKFLFTRTNMLCRRFKICPLQVKFKLFRAYCICLYDATLWSSFTVATCKKLSSYYSKCMKSFFGYCKQ